MRTLVVVMMAALLGLHAAAATVDGAGEDPPASLCQRVSQGSNVRQVGCISEGLVPRNGTYEVEFSDGVADAKKAEACWKTCDAVYSNTSMALVRWIDGEEEDDDDEGKLDCMCAVGDVIDETVIGPDVFCDSECEDSEACGGAHTFQSGVTVSYFSIYCIPRGPSGNTSATAENELRIDTGREIVKVGSIYTEEENLDERARTQRNIETMLNDIYILMSKTNIVTVVAAGLVCVVIILVLILLVWAYLFVENFDPNVTPSLFYRRPSHPRRGPDANGGNQQPRNSVYGSTNKAFDPTPETPPPAASTLPVSTISTPMGIHVDANGGRGIMKTERSEDAISDGRPGSDPTDRRDANSTFYGGGGRGGLKNTSEELGSSQESVETETADDPAPMDDVEEEVDHGESGEGSGDKTNVK